MLALFLIRDGRQAMLAVQYGFIRVPGKGEMNGGIGCVEILCNQPSLSLSHTRMAVRILLVRARSCTTGEQSHLIIHQTSFSTERLARVCEDSFV